MSRNEQANSIINAITTENKLTTLEIMPIINLEVIINLVITTKVDNI